MMPPDRFLRDPTHPVHQSRTHPHPVGLGRAQPANGRCIPLQPTISLHRTPLSHLLARKFCCVEEMPETLSCGGQRDCTFWLYRPSPFPRNNLALKATPNPVRQSHPPTPGGSFIPLPQGGPRG